MTNSTSDEKAPVSGALAGGGVAPNAAREPLHLQFFRFLERIEMRRGVVWAALIVALSAELISFFFAATWYDWWMRRFTYLSENPFALGSQNIDFPEHRLRILGPVIAWALGLRGVIGTLVPVAANVPILMTVYVVVRRRTSLPVAVVSTLLLATTHVTMTSRTLLGYHDSLVFLCLLGAMLCRSWWASSSTFFLALFGDVRAVLVVPFLIAWRLVDQPPERPFRWFVSRLLMYLLVFAVWTVLAIWLAHQLQAMDDWWSGTRSHLLGEKLSGLQPFYVHLSASMTFKSAWVFPFILCWIWSRRRKWIMVMTLLSALLIGAASLLVTDLSRALTFLFPLVIMGIIELWRVDGPKCLTVVSTCLLVNLITPFFHGMTERLWVCHYPLPFELATGNWQPAIALSGFLGLSLLMALFTRWMSADPPSPYLRQQNQDASELDRRARLWSVGYVFGLAAAVLAAAAYRFLASLDDFWLDEIWSWLIVTRVQSASQIFTDIRHDNNHFLNTWIMYGLGADCHWFFYRLPAVAAGIATVAMCGWTARRWGRLAVLTATLITGASFPLIQYSSEARGYAYALFFAVAAFEILQESLDRPRNWLDAMFACCAVLGLLAHITFVYAYVALVGWSLWRLFRRHGIWSSRHWAVLVWQILVPGIVLAWLYFVNLRYLVVGGGDEQPWGTVIRQALSLAVGGPQAEPWAGIVAIFVLVAAGLAFYQVHRAGSDLWLPLGACIFVLPALSLLATRPAVVYPRYFLVSMLFLQLLISWWLVRVFHGSRHGKILYAVFLLAILTGNAVSTSRFLAYGRGGYQAALQFMLEHSSDRDLTVGSDHDFRNSLVLRYYFPRCRGNRRLVYYSQGNWPQGGPEWFLIHSQEPQFTPRETLADELGNAYHLQAVFPYAGLSGWHWAVYRNGNRGAG